VIRNGGKKKQLYASRGNAMSTAEGVVGRQARRWRWLQIPALAAGLLLIECQLLARMGTPSSQVHTLLDLGLSPTAPVTPLLAILALLSEALIGYVVVVLALRALSLLPGLIGSVTGRAALLLSPAAVRIALDLLVGGTLVAQATLTVLPGGPQGREPAPIYMMTTASVSGVGAVASIGPTGPATRTGPAATRPLFRRLAAPLPPWLGGGPSKPGAGSTVGPPEPGTGSTVGPSKPGAGSTVERSEPGTGYTVEPGDTLWDIAADHLRPAQRSAASVHRYWRQIHRANRPAIGADPDLIHPGTRLDVPRFRSERR
jgi:hypothetical protein